MFFIFASVLIILNVCEGKLTAPYEVIDKGGDDKLLYLRRQTTGSINRRNIEVKEPRPPGGYGDQGADPRMAMSDPQMAMGAPDMGNVNGDPRFADGAQYHGNYERHHYRNKMKEFFGFNGWGRDSSWINQDQNQMMNGQGYQDNMMANGQVMPNGQFGQRPRGFLENLISISTSPSNMFSGGRRNTLPMDNMEPVQPTQFDNQRHKSW